jgi:pyruvate-formate lyase-activating enzyme
VVFVWAWLVHGFYGSRGQWCHNWEYLKRRVDSSFSDQVSDKHVFLQGQFSEQGGLGLAVTMLSVIFCYANIVYIEILPMHNVGDIIAS